MQISKSLMPKLTTVIVLVLLISSAILVLNPTANAAAGDTQVTGELPTGVTPSVTLTTNAYLAVTPNPIGKGQSPTVTCGFIHPPA